MFPIHNAEPHVELFEQPESFNPDRYLQSEYGTKTGVNDDGLRATFPFGFGRVCSGYLSIRAICGEHVIL